MISHNFVVLFQEAQRKAEAKKKKWQLLLEEKQTEVKAALANAAVTSRALDIAAREREVLSHDHAAKLDSGRKSNELHRNESGKE